MYFIRTEDGNATNVTKEKGLAEANRAMTDGKHEVAEMSAGSGRYDIRYKDGRTVALARQEGDMPVESEVSKPKEWSTTHSGFTAHRFDADNSARCRRNIRPRMGTIIRNAYQTRDYYAASESFRVCPRCDEIGV